MTNISWLTVALSRETSFRYRLEKTFENQYIMGTSPNQTTLIIILRIIFSQKENLHHMVFLNGIRILACIPHRCYEMGLHFESMISWSTIISQLQITDS